MKIARVIGTTISTIKDPKIKGSKLWVTSEHEHSALRMHGEAVFGRLYDMLHGEI